METNKKQLGDEILVLAQKILRDDHEIYDFLSYLVSLPSVGRAQLVILKALLEKKYNKFQAIINRKEGYKKAVLNSLKLQLKKIKDAS